MPGSDHPGAEVVRSGHFIGRPARDRSGAPLGTVVDLVIESVTGQPARVTGVVVSSGAWGRLLGYESPDERGPWLVSQLARWIIRRRVRQLTWAEVEIDTGAPGH